MNKKKKTVGIFASASFLNDMGSDMIYPIWPLFVTEVLGANMTVLGLIDGIGEAVVSISKAAAGYISDKIKRRKIFIWTGYMFGSLSRIGYAFTSVWQWLIPFRILDRAGKIRSAPRDAIVADISNHKDRNTNFGILEAMDNLGAVFGILICIFLFQYLGYRNLFLIAAIPSVIAVLLILFFVKEKKDNGIKLYEGMRFKDLSSNLKLFFILSAIFELGAFTYSFLLIFAKEFGFKVAFVPILYLIFTASASLFAIPFGKLAGKTGRKSVIAISFMLWALVSVLFIVFHNYIAILIAFVIYGMHKAALKPVQKTFVSELAVKKFRASALGAYQMAIGLMALPASLIAGLLWDKINIFTPFYFSLILTIIALFMLMFVQEKP
ncbi:MFS transporter, partial [Patescibacteria group bacterium]|nr:MFS transporter [Patescibacteria group bacterium]